MLHYIFIGMLLGWGAAIPIGPVNLEIMRRHLKYGIFAGMLFAFGACTADLTFLVLLIIGLLTIFSSKFIFSLLCLFGSIFILWCGISTFLSKNSHKNVVIHENKRAPSVLFGLSQWSQGYVMTLFNPFSILFWISISTQLANIAAKKAEQSAIFLGIGVLLAAMSWMIFLNLMLYFTHHQLSYKIKDMLNYIGGIILIGFAIFGFWEGIKGLIL